MRRKVLGEIHAGTSSAGFAFNGDLFLSHRISEGFEAGTRASVHTGVDYREVIAGAFVGYSLARRQDAGSPAAPSLRR